MKRITLHQPKILVFGEKSLIQFTKDFINLGLSRMYLITLEPILGLLEETINTLEENNIKVSINCSIKAEPSFNDFESILKEAQLFKADSVVAIGGGSIMDVAKLLAVQVKSNVKTSRLIGNGLITGRSTYLACLPTTAGTGSEVSPNAIFLDTNDGQKKGVISPYLVPDGTYIDPALSIGVPPQVTVATGMDALTHCIEAFTNKNAHPIVDHIALEGIRLITKYIYKAYSHGDDMEARTMLALGSMYGGICLGPVNTAAVHALAYPLGSEYKISHGLSNALLLPYVVEHNMNLAPERYAKMAQAMGIENIGTSEELAQCVLEKIKQLISMCQMPSKLSDINIPHEAIKEMATAALKIKRLLNNNLIELDLEDIITIYKKAY